MTNLHFELPKEQSSIIKVIGVGGGGSNAVNHMFNQGIVGVNFVVCNTDSQALEISPIPNKIQLGPEITQGLGAGSNPEIGKIASEESIAEITEILSKNTKMVFITAGMGGGTGTGGAPVIAKTAKDMGILTVGIVTTPFSFEGKRKLLQAEEGIQELKRSVDTILIVSNDKIREMYGNLTRSDAFANADNILAKAAKSISEIITVAGEINVDFADVEYVMKDSGVAIMGSSMAEGEDRSIRAVQGAMNSPLLNDNNIRGAKNILINISSGVKQVLIDEITEINDFVQEAAGNESDIIFGTCDDDTLGDKLSVTIIATGFHERQHLKEAANQSKVVRSLEEDKVEEIEPDPETAIETNYDQDFTVKEEVTEEMAQANEEDPSLQFELKYADASKTQETEKEPVSFYTTNSSQDIDDAEKQKLENEIAERKRILKDLSYKWNNANAITELENEPAYKRREIALEKVPHSSSSEVSRYSLNDSVNEGTRPEVRKNNSFLHDNVD